jgi:hypothetical protein
MFFWFEREGTYARYEVLQLSSGCFELRIVQADGSEQIEEFDSADDLAEKQRAIEQGLRASGWSGPHGWVL